MSTQSTFEVEEETDEEIRKLANECNVICLSLVAPFAPLRIAPRRSLVASFGYPEEFMVEEFIDIISETFPDKDSRPPLYILLHSPGGTVSSSYMIARVLRKNFKEIVGFIPHIAASGATVIALSCNEIVMGDISRLTGIDPHYDSDGETVYPLSTVRAFRNLEKILGTKTLDEISYPYQHLVQSITAEKYDEATFALKMVEGYASELMKEAGYNEDEIRQCIDGVLYNIKTHEEVITLEKAKKIGIKAVHFSEKKEYCKCWKIMKNWLKKYLLQPSPVHFIKYCIPEKTDKKSIEFNKREEK